MRVVFYGSLKIKCNITSKYNTNNERRDKCLIIKKKKKKVQHSLKATLIHNSKLYFVIRPPVRRRTYMDGKAKVIRTEQAVMTTEITLSQTQL